MRIGISPHLRRSVNLLKTDFLPTIVSRPSAIASLKLLGYLPPGRVTEESLKRGVQEFQRFHGIKIDGRVNREVLRTLHRPRCAVREVLHEWASTVAGVSDIQRIESCPWPDRRRGFTLTYVLENVPEAFVPEVTYALGAWQAVDGIVSFSPATQGQSGDFSIAWMPAKGGGLDHDLELDNLIAHARLPCEQVRPSPVHFDKSESWTVVPYDKCFTVRNVAMHEIGHILGLAHPEHHDPSIVMDPYMREYSDYITLSDWDKDELRRVYPA